MFNVVKLKLKLLFGLVGSLVSVKDIVFFSCQMVIMMKFGVLIVSVLEIIVSGYKNLCMKKMVDFIWIDIEGGLLLYEVISWYLVQFDELYCNLVCVGEGVGVLEIVLDMVVIYKENIEVFKGKIKKVMFYLVMVVVVVILVSVILLIFVVLQFEEVFKGFGVEFLVFIQMIVNMFWFMVVYWWFMLVVVVGVVVGFVYVYRCLFFMQYMMDCLILKVLVIGQIMNNSVIVCFVWIMVVIFKVGVLLVEVLGIVVGVIGNKVYEEVVLCMCDDVLVGYLVNMVMKQVNLFLYMVVQMIVIGEEVGVLDIMLFKVVEYYEQEVNNVVDVLSSLLELMIMVFIGIIVGGMVIGMYLFIFKFGVVVG